MIAAEYSGCDATKASLRTLPTNVNKLRSADDAPNPTDVCSANYHAQMHYPDVHTRPPHRLAELDISNLGPTCQDHSPAGKGKALRAKRGCLWRCSIWCLLIAKHRVTILEEAAGQINTDNGKPIWITIHLLREAGYHVAWAMLDTKNMALPQS